MAVIIGIDPGRTTGVATIGADGSIQEVCSKDFWATFFWITKTYQPSDAVIVCEQGGQNSFTYARNIAANQTAQGKVGMYIGGANREAELLAEGLTLAGFHVVKVRPTQQKKWSAITCKQQTGYAGRSNEHSRDALRLAYTYHRDQLLRLRIKQ